MNPCTATAHWVWTPNGWQFAYGMLDGPVGAPPPVPTSPPTYGTMVTTTDEIATLTDAGSGSGGDCAICSVCEGSLTKNGVVICVDGNPILANDYPATGGPWAPAFNGDGTFTWANTGA